MVVDGKVVKVSLWLRRRMMEELGLLSRRRALRNEVESDMRMKGMKIWKEGMMKVEGVKWVWLRVLGKDLNMGVKGLNEVEGLKGKEGVKEGWYFRFRVALFGD